MRLMLSSCAASAVAPVLRRLAALCLCLSLAAPASANDPPILTVYRADSRSPLEVFQTGFVGRGARMDVLAHTLGGACDETDLHLASTWVSTSSEYDEALGFARGHLEGLPPGPQNLMFLYFIRPDDTYVVVESLLQQAAEEGRASRSGYTPAQATVLDHLLRNTLISNEAEVITHYVAPENIEFARAVYFDQNEVLQIGAVMDNARFRDLGTQASRTVQDLHAFVPPASIRMDLLDDDGSSSGSDSDQCTMQCDRANVASSFAAYAATTAKVCDMPKRASPAQLDMILGP